MTLTHHRLLAPGKHRHVELRKLQSRGPKARIPAALTEADFSLSLKLIKPAEIASPNGLNEIFNELKQMA